MGGLATLNYAHLKAYLKNNRDRHQGAVHTLITIDTPNEGSPLADYLMSAANLQFQPTSNLFSSGLWGLVNCQTSWTLQQCMVHLNMPMAFPNATNPVTGGVYSTNLQTGAVYSLETSVVNGMLGQKTSIPNATMVAIAATFPDGPKPYSLLRWVLQTLAGGVWSGEGPTFKNLFGNADNDVIVSLNSQIGKTPTTQVEPEGLLEHTNTPNAGDILTLIRLHFSSISGYVIDDNVLHSPIVNQDILNALQPQ